MATSASADGNTITCHHPTTFLETQASSRNPPPSPPPLLLCPPFKTARTAAVPSAPSASTSVFCGRPAAVASSSHEATAAGAGRRRGGGGGLRMAESEKLEVSLKKPMGLVLEENVGGFGGLRVKEVADGGSAQVRRGWVVTLVECMHACRCGCRCGLCVSLLLAPAALTG